MLALIVLASLHPGSFAHALADTCAAVLGEAGYEVRLHDLYAESFDPVQRTNELRNASSTDALVEQHCDELARARLVVVVHPNWWGQPPAILKGWIDRVFRLGTAYGYPPGVPPEGAPVGLLAARAALVLNTSNTPHERETSVFGDPLDTLWKRCVFGLCGVSRVERRMYGPMSGSSHEQRIAWLADTAALARRVATEDGTPLANA